VAEYPVKRVNFNYVRDLTLFIEDNWSGGDEEVSQLRYIGFKGEWTKLKDPPLVAVYEVSPLDIIDTGTCESGGSQKGAHYAGCEAWFWTLGTVVAIKRGLTLLIALLEKLFVWAYIET
jgi:PITH domain